MKLDAFRKIIREEVRGVIKEELSLIMSTPITETKIVKKPVVEQKSKKPSLSELTETVQPTAPQKPLFDSQNPLAQMLNETAAAGEWRSINGGGYSAQDAVGFQGGMPGGSAKVVESVDQMLAGKQGITDLNQVSIDAVPDFSGLMGKMKEQGKI
jgi:hypothetical protein